MDITLRQALQLILPGLATGIGSIPVFFIKEPSQKFMDTMLGAAAGIMLSATFFSLLLPSLEASGGGIAGIGIAAAGVIIGALVVDMIDEYAPHEHLISHNVEGADAESLSKVWLFIIAISIHNFPEGLATGVATAPGSGEGGLPMAIAIGLQNMPEGLSVAMALSGLNYNRKKSFLIALITGMIEPIGAYIGFALASISLIILPFVLAFAAGAMLFVISDEMIPEIHMNANHRNATYGLIVGFIIMMSLDYLL